MNALNQFQTHSHGLLLPIKLKPGRFYLLSLQAVAASKCFWENNDKKTIIVPFLLFLSFQ